jgi:hypothetical protein
MIANSGSDERGRASGGQQGDQTGREWCIREWYNRPWSCVLRYPDLNVAKLIAELATEGATNNNIGYDQSRRTTFWNELKKVGYRPANIKVRCSEDCSAGVSACVKAAGYLKNINKLKNISENNWTGSMRSAFRSAGFEVLTDSKYLVSDKYLKPGDILLNDQHHTAINLTYGSAVNETPKYEATELAQKFSKSLAGTYTVKTTWAYFRKGAGSKKKLIKKLKKGDKVTCHGYYSLDGKNRWLYCLFGTQIGFVWEKRLKK